MSNESSPISGMAKNVKRRDTIRRLSIHAFLSSILPPFVDVLVAFRTILFSPPLSFLCY